MSDFLRRSDELAFRKGLRVEDLPELLGVSRATLFRWRSAKSVPRKAYLALEAAERAAAASSASLDLIKNAADASTDQAGFNARMESVSVVHRELVALRREVAVLRARLAAIAKMASESIDSEMTE